MRWFGQRDSSAGGHGAWWWMCGWVPPPDLPYSFTPCGWVVPGHVCELQNRQFSPSDHGAVVFLIHHVPDKTLICPSVL